jgi:DNA-directed RNA polymerase specialized sigma subunit
VDLVETLVRGLDERTRRICVLRLEGLALTEIADQVGCAEATVIRKLEGIKRRLRRLCPAEVD